MYIKNQYTLPYFILISNSLIYKNSIYIYKKPIYSSIFYFNFKLVDLYIFPASGEI
jgi:hypothetical protein